MMNRMIAESTVNATRIVDKYQSLPAFPESDALFFELRMNVRSPLEVLNFLRVVLRGDLDTVINLWTLRTYSFTCKWTCGFLHSSIFFNSTGMDFEEVLDSCLPRASQILCCWWSHPMHSCASDWLNSPKQNEEGTCGNETCWTHLKDPWKKHCQVNTKVQQKTQEKFGINESLILGISFSVPSRSSCLFGSHRAFWVGHLSGALVNFHCERCPKMGTWETHLTWLCKSFTLRIWKDLDRKSPEMGCLDLIWQTVEIAYGQWSRGWAVPLGVVVGLLHFNIIRHYSQLYLYDIS